MRNHRLVTLLSVAAITTASSLAVASPAHAEDAIVKLVSVESGKCLQPVNGSLTQGQAIVQETCNGSVAQQWTVTQGEYNAEYANRSSGMCIDAFGGATNGTSIVQWRCASPTISNQRWKYGPKVNTSSPGELESGIDGSGYNYCISAPGLQNGDAMLLYSCDFGSSELWFKPSP